MHARLNVTQWNPERVDEGLRLTEETIIPGYQEKDGFQGYLLLTERDGDKAIAITLWDTEEHMEASAEVARAMIPRLKDILKAPPQTEHYEVLFNVRP